MTNIFSLGTFDTLGTFIEQLMEGSNLHHFANKNFGTEYVILLCLSFGF
jgi:hypothetical protein